jgi:uncharacterized protein
MKLVPDANSNLSISSHGKGWIEISGVRHHESILLTSSGYCQTLAISDVNQLTAQEFEAIGALSIDIALIGTGLRQKPIPTELLVPLMTNGVGFEYMDTAAACRTFNVLSNEGRNVGALLLIEQNVE